MDPPGISINMIQGMRHGKFRKPWHPDARLLAGFSAEELRRLQLLADS